MSGWAGQAVLGFDTETTGVRTGEDRIVTAALVRRDATGTRTRTWILDPGIDIPAAATAVHGITTGQARAAGAPARRALAEIAHHVSAALRAGVPLVAFNAPFDLSILEAELRRHGLPSLARRLGRVPSPVLDPLVLDRALDPCRPGARRLADLCAEYGVRPGAALHTAEVDARATLDLLHALLRRHPGLARMALEQVHAWQVTVQRHRAAERAARRPRGALPRPAPEGAWPLVTARVPRLPQRRE